MLLNLAELGGGASTGRGNEGITARTGFLLPGLPGVGRQVTPRPRAPPRHLAEHHLGLSSFLRRPVVFLDPNCVFSN